MASSIGGDFTELFTGANTAATPTVTTRPPGQVTARQWTAPKVSSPGQVTVDHGDLDVAASVIKAHIAEIEYLIGTLQQLYGSFGCLSAWPAGQQMCQNLMDLAGAFQKVLQQTVGAHAGTAKKLTDTASTYKDTEHTAARSARKAAAKTGAPGGLNSLLNGSTGSTPSTTATSTPYIHAGKNGQAAAGGGSPGGSAGSSGWGHS